MKKLFALLAVAAVALLTASTATAAGHANPFNIPGHSGHGGLFKKTPLPAFQAAPWYTYWPYNSHFQTPAPLPGAEGFGGGGWTNPYFAPAYGPGYGPHK